MSLPYVANEVVFNAAVLTETKELKSEFERCQLVAIQMETTGFSGTIDIQGKLHELSSWINVPYIRQDALALQTPAVAQLALTTNTATVVYVILGYWRRFRIVMTRSAGSIIVVVAGSSDAMLFPRVIQT